MNSKIQVISKKNRSYLLVPNEIAGRENVYTVYLIPQEQRSLDNSEAFDIVGRELSLKFIRQYLSELDKYQGNVILYRLKWPK